MQAEDSTTTEPAAVTPGDPPLRIVPIARPTRTNWEWFSLIAWRVIFPPILLWDLTKLIFNRLLGNFVGRIILPAQNMRGSIDYSSLPHK